MFKIPNIFKSGTKAKAVEVNENFKVLTDEINKLHEKINTLVELVENKTPKTLELHFTDEDEL